MSLFKNEFPILEYDDSKDSVIMPDHEKLEIVITKKCVFSFLADKIDEIAKKYKAETIWSFDSITKSYPVYKINYDGIEIALMQAPVGAAASAQILDWLIFYGAREIISTGSCGNLTDITENTFLVPTQALRDEGASYHYLKPSRFVNINKKALKAIEKALMDNNLSYEEVKTWSTDGFFRETGDMVSYRINEGCNVVEMECSALAAVAEFRGAIWGEILYTADSLSDLANYDQRNFGRDSEEYALKLAIEAVINI